MSSAVLALVLAVGAVPEVPTLQLQDFEPAGAYEKTWFEKYGPFVVTGAGAVVAIVGGILYLGASRSADDINKRYVEGSVLPLDDRDKVRSLETRGRVGSTLGIIGLAGVFGGGTWLLVSMSTKSDSGVGF